MVKCDFSGYATRNDIQCEDGRIIKKNAFATQDGTKVPLVWNHEHNDPDNVLGHAILENRDDGVYAYCYLNETESGKQAKEIVQHGDVRSLSIWANKLKQIGGDVIHGTIRELSLVLAGANSGAFVDFVLAHGEDGDDGLFAGYDENIMIYQSLENDVIEHSGEKEESKKEEKMDGDTGEKKEKTVGDVLNTLTEEQRTVVEAIIGQVLNEKKTEPEKKDESEKGGEKEMIKHNVFENEGQEANVLSHDAMTTIIADAKRYGSLKDSVIAHSAEYGIEQIDWLFPEATNLNKTPELIKRNTDWVQGVISGVKHSPFSRIKSMFADITEDEARAKGYIKGNLKKEEVFTLLKRTTTPTTIYKKQKLDRDDIVDITDFDVVSWLKSEMRLMLDEEIARAILVGDGRLSSSDDKISETNIRPIWKDDDLYTVKAAVNVANGATDSAKAKEFINTVIRSRKEYKGSGNPTLYTTEDQITECLLLEDTIGHKLYKTIDELRTTLRVSNIVTVEVMENLSRTGSNSETRTLAGLIVNLQDYNVGADKGGAVNMFDDFDIDYNQQKYLIETRCSGALVKPYSAIALEVVEAAQVG